MMPAGTIRVSPELINNKTQPTIDNPVAITHFRPGLFLKKNHSINPANMGELPIVTTVPTATPVKFTEVKNSGWKNAIAIAAKMVCFHDHFLKFILFNTIQIINNKPPPTNERIIAMVIGWIPSDKYVWVVPTVPHKIAAKRTSI